MKNLTGRKTGEGFFTTNKKDKLQYVCVCDCDRHWRFINNPKPGAKRTKDCTTCGAKMFWEVPVLPAEV